MKIFDNKENVLHVAETVPYDTIIEKDYNLSVSAYVEPEDTREVVEIAKLNADLRAAIVRIDQLRADIDAIVAEIEA